jgi:hypothetical protein
MFISGLAVLSLLNRKGSPLPRLAIINVTSLPDLYRKKRHGQEVRPGAKKSGQHFFIEKTHPPKMTSISKWPPCLKSRIPISHLNVHTVAYLPQLRKFQKYDTLILYLI